MAPASANAFAEAGRPGTITTKLVEDRADIAERIEAVTDRRIRLRTGMVLAVTRRLWSGPERPSRRSRSGLAQLVGLVRVHTMGWKV